jgi:hypothetical protein
MMIDIREHGGNFGGGKYRKGSKVFLSNTETKTLSTESMAEIGWDYLVNKLIVHYDGSYTVLWQTAGYQWITGYDKGGNQLFSFNPLGTNTYTIPYVLKHTNGKYYVLTSATNLYEYIGTGSSMTLLFNNANFSTSVFYIYQGQGNNIVLVDSANAFRFNVVDIVTKTVIKTVFATNPPSTIQVNDFKVFGGMLYIKNGGNLGQFTEITLNAETTTPACRNSPTSYYAIGLGVSNNYLVSYRTDNNKVLVLRRSDFSLVWETANGGGVSNGFYISETEGKIYFYTSIGSGYDTNGVAIYNMTTGVLLSSQILMGNAATKLVDGIEEGEFFVGTSKTSGSQTMRMVHRIRNFFKLSN